MPRNALRLLALGVTIVAVAAACTKSENNTASGSGTMVPSPFMATGDADRGAEVFHGNCSRCHGETGREGGVGPALAHESSRKNYEQTVAWIMGPLPPMPKLYPAPLNERAVHDVATYVQKL